MSTVTYTFYEEGTIPGIPGQFAAGTQVDVDTSTNTITATRPIGSAPPLITSTTIPTAGVNAVRINPASAVSNYAMQAGTQAGQTISIMNESAYTVSFLASGSSNVADGTSDSILPLSSKTYVWNTNTSLWYGAASSGTAGFSSFYVNVRDKGALGDGTTDDTAAIQSAINVAAGGVTDGTNTVGGMVVFPPGTYIHTGLTLFSFVMLRGVGHGATILKLKNSANADCIQGYNAPSLMGSSNTGGIVNWGIRDIIIDGNKGNQSGTSYGIRQYGYGFILQNVIIRNTLSDIIYSDWNGGSASSNDSMEAKVINCKFHDSGTGSLGLNWSGPHDSTVVGTEIYKTGSHAFYIAPNASGMKFESCHGFNMTTGVNAVTWLIEATGGQYTNCVAEGSDAVNVVLLAAKNSWVGGSIFCFNTGTPTNNVGGIQIGQAAGQTPYARSTFQSAGVTTAVAPFAYIIDSLFSKCEGTNGAVWFANDGGNGFVRGPVSLEINANANKVLTGTVAGSTRVDLIPNGVTADGTTGKGGWVRYGIAANKAVTITDLSNDIFNFNTSSKRLELLNAAALRIFSDNYSTRTVEISGGTISMLQSTSAAATATSGTITTSGVGIARVNPAGNITNVILQSGTLTGQKVIVRNESAFTVAFDTSGTSHVADGATSVIPANCSREFEWSGSLWYRMA